MGLLMSDNCNKKRTIAITLCIMKKFLSTTFSSSPHRSVLADFATPNPLQEFINLGKLEVWQQLIPLI